MTANGNGTTTAAGSGSASTPKPTSASKPRPHGGPLPTRSLPQSMPSQLSRSHEQTTRPSPRHHRQQHGRRRQARDHPRTDPPRLPARPNGNGDSTHTLPTRQL